MSANSTRFSMQVTISAIWIQPSMIKLEEITLDLGDYKMAKIPECQGSARVLLGLAFHTSIDGKITA